MVESGGGQPRIDLNLFEGSDNKTSEGLFEALLSWTTGVKATDANAEKAYQMAKAFDGLYRDGIVRVKPMDEKEVENSEPFAMDHQTDREGKTHILIHLHLETIIEAISFASESELKIILKRFTKVVLETVQQYRELAEKGARFEHH